MIKIVSNKKLHSGYVDLYECKLQINSLNPLKPSINFSREVLACSDSVHVLIYIPSIDSFVFCEEFRAGVFLNKHKDNPYVMSCVAGAIDKNFTPEQTAYKEAFEETGIKLDNLKQIAITYKSPGVMTEKTHIFYSEVNEIPEEGYFGMDDEDIRTHILSREETYKKMDNFQFMDASGVIALNWFRFYHKPD